MGFMLTFCKGRPVSPKAICSSPVGLTGVLFKALFEFFSSAHVHSKLNLLFWRGGAEKPEGRERSEVFRLYFQASNCLFEQSFLTPFSFVTVPLIPAVVP